MNKEQAHQLLVQATGILQLNREDHSKIVQALEVLKPAKPAEKSSKPN